MMDDVTGRPVPAAQPVSLAFRQQQPLEPNADRDLHPMRDDRPHE